jgi:hypothetical protein
MEYSLIFRRKISYIRYWYTVCNIRNLVLHFSLQTGSVQSYLNVILLDSIEREIQFWVRK